VGKATRIERIVGKATRIGRIVGKATKRKQWGQTKRRDRSQINMMAAARGKKLNKRHRRGNGGEFDKK
jgi:hypothetical protein